MTLDEFSRGLDRYGPDLARWPESEQSVARAFLREDQRAAALHASALRLDALLGATVAPVPMDARLLGRIVSGTAGSADGVVFRPTRRFVVAASAALVALFILGFGLGTTAGFDLGDDVTASLLFSGPDGFGGLL
jgi:hypothetical protein